MATQDGPGPKHRQRELLVSLIVAAFRYYMSPGIPGKLRSKLEALIPMLRKELSALRSRRVRSQAGGLGGPP